MGGAVAATRRISFALGLKLGIAAMACSLSIVAAILPEDRFDALDHGYAGGGVRITGPSFLLRKQVGDSSSVSVNHYIDSISSASIDVVTAASPYSEKRTENSVGLNYLLDKITMDFGFGTSRENDYDANSFSFGISQDLFGDMTNVSMAYSMGRDTVGRRGDPGFSEDVRRQNYRIGLTQILTPKLLLDAAWETITDEGYLNNPYRSVRYLDSESPLGYAYEPEVYPRTRDSNAVSLRLQYYLPYRAALRGEYRWFNDSWGIRAHTYEINYAHPLKERWMLDLRYRYYRQSQADFYSDLFPFRNAQNFIARDKELSAFDSSALGIGLSYEFLSGGQGFLQRGSVTLSYDRLRFDYDNFRDLRQTGFAAGEEPFYGFTADVTQFYLSLWY